MRRAALEVLLEAERGGVFVDEALAHRIRLFEERDRHLLQEITFGVLRHRNTIDHLLDQHLKLPTHRQKPAICQALRLGAYQIVYLDRVPTHAAVHQTLEGLKSLGAAERREVGFVNAVLHRISEEIRIKSEEPPVDPDDPAVLPIRRGFCLFSRPVLPQARSDLHHHLTMKYSHPVGWIRRWLERYGEEEARELLRENNKTPPVCARVTSRAPSREALLEALQEAGRQAAPGPLESSIVLGRPGNLETLEAFQQRWFQVQDLTAIEIGSVLAPPAGARVLDLCAAPGGKAAQLLEALGPGGCLVAADRSEERLETLRENLAPIGGEFTTVVLPEEPADIDLGARFSHILVDVPCSNTGVLARRPEARWRVRPGDLESLARLQSGLLAAALRHLEPGGRLLYSTCSIEPDENENVIARAFAEHADLEELATKLYLPHRVPGDGGFYSLLRRSR